MFVDREREAAALAQALTPGKASLVRLWGRRRLGKTSLIRAKVPDILYLYIDESETAVQLPRLQKDIAERTGLAIEAGDWSDLFRGLAPIREVVVLDEFQRLLDTDKAAVAALQDAWDNHLRPSGTRMVLCGSSIGMMQRLVRGKGAPLMGRFTSQMQLHPLPFRHVREMHPARGIEDCVAWYGVFGGTPFYQEQARGETLGDAVRHAFLAPAAPLLGEPENLLASELRKPATYAGILQAVGAGHHRLGDIAATLQKPSTALTPYVRVLMEDLGILRKDDPVLGAKQSARYDFADPFFGFYYRFIHPNISSIQEGLVAPLEADIETNLPTFLGPVWEQVVRETLRAHAGTTWKGLDLRVDRIGAWWSRRGDHEIDVVATSSRHAILGSCKWRAAPMDEGDLAALREATREVPLQGRSPSFLLASRAGFTEGLRKVAEERGDMALVSLEDVAW